MKTLYPYRKREINLNQVKYLMFIDIETIGTINILESCLPFEIGMKIIDIPNDKVIIEKSYLVRRFINNKYLMNCTFSATKYPFYIEKLKNDKRYKLYSPNEIAKDMQKIIDKYDIDTMVAHNGKFDYTMLNLFFNEFEVHNPIKKLDVLDTMEMAKDFTMSPTYEKWCLMNRDITSLKNGATESDFITPSGRVRTTAQAIYSFIAKDPNFKESHTGLEDISIEYAIFKACKRYNNIVRLNFAPTWKDYKKVVNIE